MKIWPWWKIQLKILCSWRLFLKWCRAPKDYSTFDGWHACNLAKVDIATEAIGCKNPAHLIEQEKELMAYRKAACPTIEEWFGKYSKMSWHSEGIDGIVRSYALEGKCHREFDGKKPGIVCYCNKKISIKKIDMLYKNRI